eukprot:CAMPEP_0185729544 /NCGR_PEP_ID=MMETSP1171-20130828/6311_1 /TAXON_ID=374046 /ORGANISM="Helicotheca tamensis, Strain CCMP826" /LENGTH=442 /DNA_ID=CAMNT_0028398415 /DNA_START=56 /DNA_END=1384 /DNA_ORIENTATION=-
MKLLHPAVICSLASFGHWGKETYAFTFPIKTKQPTLAPLYSSLDKSSRVDYVGEYAKENGYVARGRQPMGSSDFFSGEKGTASSYNSPGVHDVPSISWDDDSFSQGGKLSRPVQDGYWGDTGRDSRSGTYGQEMSTESYRGNSWNNSDRQGTWSDSYGQGTVSNYRGNSWYNSNRQGTWSDSYGQGTLSGSYGRGTLNDSYGQSSWSSSGWPDRRGSNDNMYGQRHVHGGTLQTFSSNTPYDYHPDKNTHVTMTNNGRPIFAEMTLWDGPYNTPQRVRSYSMDGNRNRFKGTFSGKGTLSVRNTGPSQYPAVASVSSSLSSGTSGYPKPATQGHPKPAMQSTKKRDGAVEIQGGGTLKTWPIVGSMGRATVELESEGRPVYAIVELWQGPNNVQQVAEIHSQDGYDRPYSMEIDLDSYYGSSTVAIRNIGPIEYPITARVSY